MCVCIAASFLRVSRHGDHLAQVFYQHLFRLPAAAADAVFGRPVDPASHADVGAEAFVENLRQTQRLVPCLLELGQRHARYGVQPQFLGRDGRALLDARPRSMKRGHEVEAAWSQPTEAHRQVIAQGLGQPVAGEWGSQQRHARTGKCRSPSQTQWAA